MPANLTQLEYEIRQLRAERDLFKRRWEYSEKLRTELVDLLLELATKQEKANELE